MYRILIVDDEPYIADWICGIVELITEFELDVYRVYSAKDALDLFSRAKVDILISDICMPEMNGLDLLESVKESWPSCKVIMLTGHQEFDYAYESIRKNAFAYILKNEDDDNILSVIRQAVTKIEIEYKNNQLLADTRKKVSETMTLLQKDFLIDLLNGVYQSNDILSNKFKSLEIPFDENIPFIIIAGRLETSGDGLCEDDKDICLILIKNLLLQHLGKYYTIMCAYYDPSKFFCIMQQYDHSNADTNTKIHNALITGSLELSQKVCSNRFGAVVSFAYTNSFVCIDKLSYKFAALDRLISNLHDDEKGLIINDNSITEKHGNGSGRINENFKNIYGSNNFFDKMSVLIESGQKDAYFEHLGVIKDSFSGINSFNDENAIEIYYKAALLLLTFINKKNLIHETTKRINLKCLMHPESFKSWDRAVKYLYSLSLVLFDIGISSPGNINLVQFAKEYIVDNISDDISLIKLSEVTGYNPSYISRIFKEVTDQTLSDYISLVRIHKVQELMKQKKLSLNDIALSVGLQSRQYFNRFIKKMTNMTPQEYYRHLNHEPTDGY